MNISGGLHPQEHRGEARVPGQGRLQGARENDTDTANLTINSYTFQ